MSQFDITSIRNEHNCVIKHCLKYAEKYKKTHDILLRTPLIFISFIFYSSDCPIILQLVSNRPCQSPVLVPKTQKLPKSSRVWEPNEDQKNISHQTDPAWFLTVLTNKLVTRSFSPDIQRAVSGGGGGGYFVQKRVALAVKVGEGAVKFVQILFLIYTE